MNCSAPPFEASPGLPKFPNTTNESSMHLWTFDANQICHISMFVHVQGSPLSFNGNNSAVHRGIRVVPRDGRFCQCGWCGVCKRHGGVVVVVDVVFDVDKLPAQVLERLTFGSMVFRPRVLLQYSIQGRKAVLCSSLIKLVRGFFFDFLRV